MNLSPAVASSPVFALASLHSARWLAAFERDVVLNAVRRRSEGSGDELNHRRMPSVLTLMDGPRLRLRR